MGRARAKAQGSKSRRLASDEGTSCRWAHSCGLQGISAWRCRVGVMDVIRRSGSHVLLLWSRCLWHSPYIVLLFYKCATAAAAAACGHMRLKVSTNARPRGPGACVRYVQCTCAALPVACSAVRSSALTHPRLTAACRTAQSTAPSSPRQTTCGSCKRTARSSRGDESTGTSCGP